MNNNGGGVVFCFFFEAQLPPLSLHLSAKAVDYVNLQGLNEATSKTHIMLTKGKKNMKRVLFHHLLSAQHKLPTLRRQALTCTTWFDFVLYNAMLKTT